MTSPTNVGYAPGTQVLLQSAGGGGGGGSGSGSGSSGNTAAAAGGGASSTSGTSYQNQGTSGTSYSIGPPGSTAVNPVSDVNSVLFGSGSQQSASSPAIATGNTGPGAQYYTTTGGQVVGVASGSAPPSGTNASAANTGGAIGTSGAAAYGSNTAGFSTTGGGGGGATVSGPTVSTASAPATLQSGASAYAGTGDYASVFGTPVSVTSPAAFTSLVSAGVIALGSQPAQDPYLVAQKIAASPEQYSAQEVTLAANYLQGRQIPNAPSTQDFASNSGVVVNPDGTFTVSSIIGGQPLVFTGTLPTNAINAPQQAQQYQAVNEAYSWFSANYNQLYNQGLFKSATNATTTNGITTVTNPIVVNLDLAGSVSGGGTTSVPLGGSPQTPAQIVITQPTVVTTPTELSAIANFAALYGLETAVLKPGEAIIVTPEGFNPNANLQNAEQWADAIVAYDNVLTSNPTAKQVADSQQNYSPAELTPQQAPGWYQLLENAGAEGGVYLGNLAGVASITPSSYAQSTPSPSASSALSRAASALSTDELTPLLLDKQYAVQGTSPSARGQTVSSGTPSTSVPSPYANNLVQGIKTLSSVYNQGTRAVDSYINNNINNLAATPYNLNQPLSAGYLENTAGSFLQTRRNFLTNPLGTVSSVPAKYTEAINLSNQLVSEGASPWLPIVVQELMLAPLQVATAGGGLLSGAVTPAKLTTTSGIGAGANILFNSQGRTAAGIVQNGISGATAGEIAGVLDAVTPIQEVLSSVISRTGTYDLIDNLASTGRLGAVVGNLIAKAPDAAQSAYNFGNWYALNRGLSDASQGRVSTTQELLSAYEQGAVIGAIIPGVAAIVEPFFGQTAGRVASNTAVGTIFTGLNAAQGLPLPTSAALGYGFAFLPEVAGRVNPIIAGSVDFTHPEYEGFSLGVRNPFGSEDVKNVLTYTKQPELSNPFSRYTVEEVASIVQTLKETDPDTYDYITHQGAYESGAAPAAGQVSYQRLAELLSNGYKGNLLVGPDFKGINPRADIGNLLYGFSRSDLGQGQPSASEVFKSPLEVNLYRAALEKLVKEGKNSPLSLEDFRLAKQLAYGLKGLKAPTLDEFTLNLKDRSKESPVITKWIKQNADKLKEIHGSSIMNTYFPNLREGADADLTWLAQYKPQAIEAAQGLAKALNAKLGAPNRFVASGVRVTDTVLNKHIIDGHIEGEPDLDEQGNPIQAGYAAEFGLKETGKDIGKAGSVPTLEPSAQTVRKLAEESAPVVFYNLGDLESFERRLPGMVKSQETVDFFMENLDPVIRQQLASGNPYSFGVATPARLFKTPLDALTNSKVVDYYLNNGKFQNDINRLADVYRQEGKISAEQLDTYQKFDPSSVPPGWVTKSFVDSTAASLLADSVPKTEGNILRTVSGYQPTASAPVYNTVSPSAAASPNPSSFASRFGSPASYSRTSTSASPSYSLPSTPTSPSASYSSSSPSSPLTYSNSPGPSVSVGPYSLPYYYYESPSVSPSQSPYYYVTPQKRGNSPETTYGSVPPMGVRARPIRPLPATVPFSNYEPSLTTLLFPETEKAAEEAYNPLLKGIVQRPAYLPRRNFNAGG